MLLFKSRPVRPPVLLFFAALLALGLVLYRDYGISWDEPLQRFTGAVTIKHVAERVAPSLLSGETNRLPELDAYIDRDHGTAFEAPAVALEAVLHLKDKRDIYMFRHLLTFVVCWLGTIAIYRLAERRFADWRIGLLAAALAVLTPRLFAESFYNSKDALFMAVFAIAMATGLSFILQPRLRTALVHAVATAFATDIRLMAVILPAASLAMLAARLAKREVAPAKALPAAALYLAVTAVLVVAMWVWLWSDPVGHFLQAFANMERFRWVGETLYLGVYVPGTALPWHYVPVWMAITLPPLYLALFVVGLMAIVYRLLRSGIGLWRSESELQDCFFLGLLVAPIAAVIVLHSVLYGGWRHLYFVYPAFLLIAVGGWQLLWNADWLPRTPRQVVLALISAATALNTAVWMWRAHPLENVYFNVLAGSDVRDRFDLDYWGLANREALEYILSKDHSPSITVRAVSETPLDNSAAMIAPTERQRLKIVDEGPARYLVNNYYMMKDKDPGKYAPGYAPFHDIKVGDQIILTIFKSADAE